MVDSVLKINNHIKERKGTNFVLFHLISLFFCIPFLCHYLPVKAYVKKVCGIENAIALHYGIVLKRVDIKASVKMRYYCCG
jgi:hypothetical protein